MNAETKQKAIAVAGWAISALAILGVSTLLVTPEHRSPYFWHRILWAQFLAALVWAFVGSFVSNALLGRKAPRAEGGILPAFGFVVTAYAALSATLMLSHAFLPGNDFLNRFHLAGQIVSTAAVRAHSRRELFRVPHRQLKTRKENPMEEIDRRAIRNYFKPFPWWAVFCIIIGLPLLALKGLGLIPIAIGVLGIVLHKKPTDQQMDAWFEGEIKVLNQQALKKLGVDDSDCVAAPVVVYGPRVENTGGAEILIKSGDDGFVRYNPVDFSVMHSGQHQLFCYQCSYDRTTGNRLAERTD